MSLKIGQEFKDMQRHKKKATLAKCRCKNIYLICRNDQKKGCCSEGDHRSRVLMKPWQILKW